MPPVTLAGSFRHGKACAVFSPGLRKETPPVQRVRFALFDFDGTLAPGDSIIPYLWYAWRRGKLPFRRLAVAAWAGMMPILMPGRFTNTWAKNQALSFLQGHAVAEMDAFALEFFHQRLEKQLFPAGIAELRRLQQAGYRVLLVSASPEAYMLAVGRALGVDAVLATPCGLTPDGQRYTGLVGENCKGVEKSLRIAAYLAANHLELDWEQSRAYGDSLSDVPMLTLTASPVCVNPGPKLRGALPEATCVRWDRKEKRNK